MKKILICLMATFIGDLSSAQNLQFHPKGTSPSYEWLNDFIKNNNEGITVLPGCDVYVKSTTDYGDDYGFLVLRKQRRGLMIFDLKNESYLLPYEKLPPGNYNEYFTNKMNKIIRIRDGGSLPEGTLPLTPTNFFNLRKKKVLKA